MAVENFYFLFKYFYKKSFYYYYYCFFLGRVSIIRIAITYNIILFLFFYLKTFENWLLKLYDANNILLATSILFCLVTFKY